MLELLIGVTSEARETDDSPLQYSKDIFLCMLFLLGDFCICLA